MEDWLAGLPDRVRAAVEAVDRRCFVPPRLRDRAWDDGSLPIGGGQTISQPRLVARMVELAAPPSGGRVLDVGTGSGYHAAVLAASGCAVWGVERRWALVRRARANLRAAGFGDDVRVRWGDGAFGCAEGAPFDAINVAAAIDGEVPCALVEQLADGGRLVAPLVASSDEQVLVVLRRSGSRLERSEHGFVRFVPFVRG